MTEGEETPEQTVPPNMSVVSVDMAAILERAKAYAQEIVKDVEAVPGDIAGDFKKLEAYLVKFHGLPANWRERV